MLRLLSLFLLLALSFGLTKGKKERRDWTSYLDEGEKYAQAACAAGVYSTATAWWAAVFYAPAAVGALSPCAALAAKKLLFDTNPAEFYEYYMKDKK